MNRQADRKIDFLEGAPFGQIVRFSLPLAATGVLQLLFNAADTIVVGKFSGSNSLAAVGATGSLINLLIGAFIGISIGSNILIARYIGSRQRERTETAVHTSLVLSLLLGAIVTALGLVFSEPMLRMMDTPDEILPLSALYLRIYFLGMPGSVLYNFGAAILRADGDTKRPLIFLSVSGAVNVILNLVLVIAFRLDVAGVAIATTVSQYVAVAMLLRSLFQEEGWCRVELKKLRMDWREALRMIQIGLPAGLQSVIFNISNVMIQQAVNSFGSVVIAANTAAANLGNFTYTAMNAVFNAVVTFTSQNLGAGRLSRIGKIYLGGIAAVLLIGVPMCAGSILFGRPLLSVYIARTDPDYTQIIETGMVRLWWVVAPYFLCGIMETCCGMVRGLGRAWLPMFVSAVGSCLLRIVWIKTLFAADPTLPCLYISYPVSWVLTSLAHHVCYVLILRRIRRQMPNAQ